jgi:hypothetical protein
MKTRIRFAAMLFCALSASCSMPLITKAMVASAKDSSGLIVTPGNRSVILDWTPDPTASGYVLYYTKNGGLPSETNGIALRSAEPPLTISGLANGDSHVFLLKASYESGASTAQGPISVVPLAPATLAPQVTGELGQIRVSWNPIRGTDTFEVWRAVSADGLFENVSGPVRATSWTDTSAEIDCVYYYAVKPQSSGPEQLSQANTGMRSPFEIERLPIESTTPSFNARNVSLRGNYAYVANAAYIDPQNGSVTWNGGLDILDVSDPHSPRTIGSLSWPNANPQDILLSADGRYAYLANGAVVYSYHALSRGSIIAVDVLDPAHPVLAANVSGTGNQFFNPKALALSQDGLTLFAAIGMVYTYDAGIGTITGNLCSFDLSQAGSPTFDSGSASWASADPNDLLLSRDGAYLYVADRGGSGGLISALLSGASIGTPVQALLLADYPAGWSIGCYGIARNGDRLYLANSKGLLLVDAAVPAVPVITGSYASARPVTAVSVRGNYAFLSCNDGTWGGSAEITAVSAGTGAVAMVKSRRSMTAAGGSVLSDDGKLLFVADGRSGLRVLSAEAASVPAPLGQCGSALSGQIILSGDFAYTLSWPDGPVALPSLALIDVSAPASPRTRGSIQLQANPERYAYGAQRISLAASGNLLYYCAPYKGFGVIDVSDPDEPRSVGFYALGDFVVNRIALSGPYAFLPSTSGLIVLDLTEPAAPSLKGIVLSMGRQMENIVLKDGYAYATDFLNGLTVFDISGVFIDADTPADMYCLGGSDPAFRGTDVRIYGNSAFVYDVNSSGLRMMDISNPTSPVGVGVVRAGSVGTNSLENLGNYLFSAFSPSTPDASMWDATSSGICPMGSIVGSSADLVNFAGRGRYLYANTSDKVFETFDLLD